MNKDKHNIKTNNNNHNKHTKNINNPVFSNSDRTLDISKMSDDMKIFHFNKCVSLVMLVLPKLPDFSVNSIYSACAFYYSLLYHDIDDTREKWMTIATSYNLRGIMNMSLLNDGSCTSHYIGLMNEYCDKNASTIDVRQKELLKSPNFMSEYDKCFS